MSKKLWAIILMILVGFSAVTVSSCGSDSDEEAATNVTTKIYKVWHSKNGGGLPAHLKDMVIDLSKQGKMKVYVKYDDNLQQLMGLEDVWYEGQEYSYEMNLTYDQYGDHANIALDDGITMMYLKGIKIKQFSWYHYDYGVNAWADAFFEPYDVALNAKKLPFHDLLTAIVGQWLIEDGQEKNFLKYYSSYGDYLVINEAPFYIDNDGQFRYSNNDHSLGVQKVEGGNVIMSIFHDNTQMRKYVLSDPKHADVFSIKDDATNLMYQISKLDVPAIK
ncbi:MAG: hypothetical protein IKX36_00675 [Prevotella sp.]|nr:hypothetical protein [Prevotella sp.]